MRTPFVCGNWKMYKTAAEARKFAKAFLAEYEASDVRVGIFAPFTQLPTLVRAFRGTGVVIGAQNVFYEEEGAYTGEVSARMLDELGVKACLVGHSERRGIFHETDEDVRKKLVTLFRHEIAPILCVGESLEQREAGKANEIVSGQIAADLEGIPDEDVRKLTVAYEPIWAIGTGKTASAADANEMCGVIREKIAALYGEETADCVTIQYGGSVKPANVTEIMNQYEIDGVLVGGASLKPDSFLSLVNF